VSTLAVGSPTAGKPTLLRAHGAADYDLGASIRWLFWVYILLVLFEGALRKWVLPGFSSYLLFVRDPVAVAIYILAFKNGFFPTQRLALCIYGVAIAATMASFLVDVANPGITVYGFKSNFLHLPLIYVGALVLKRRDVVAIGKLFLITGILMLPVVIMQFRTSPNSWWNVGPGGSVGTQMMGAHGHVRVAGFFAFINGTAQFCAMMAAFVVFGLLEPRNYSKILLVVAGAALILTVAVSTSRATLGAVGTVLAMVVVMIFTNAKFVGRIASFVATAGVLLFLVSTVDIFKEGKETMMARLTETGDAERGVVETSVSWSDRLGNDFKGGFAAMGIAPILGYGIGFGTNGASMLMEGRLRFMLSEGEWGRCILEMGPILGAMYLGIRLAMVLAFFVGAMQSAQEGDSLSLLLFGSSVWVILCGQFGLASNVGFAVVGGALCLAARNAAPLASKEVVDLVPTHRVRSRSHYAQFLYGKPSR